MSSPIKMSVVVLLLLVATNAMAAENWPRGTSQSVLLKQGAKQLSASQVRSLIGGSTEAAKYERANWPVAYYSADGSMYIKQRDGKRTVEKYKLRSDGGVCYDKNFRKCHYYLRLNGEIVAVRYGSVLAVAQFVPGKRL